MLDGVLLTFVLSADAMSACRAARREAAV